MLSYIIRRLLYVPLIVIGVMVLTFLLFFVKLTPDDMARADLDKRASPEAIQNWKRQRGYDKPQWVNLQPGHAWYDSLFCAQMKKLATFDFGVSDRTGEDLNQKFRDGAVPSLLITLPAFLVGLLMAVVFALYLVLVRNSLLDRAGTILCVVLMSVVPMLYIIVGQTVFALMFKWFPVSGFDVSTLGGVRFLLLPVAIFALIHLGADVRLYRAVFIEEISHDYVRTARAKGVSNERLLFTHVLKNGLIALITLVVAYLPLLVLGSLLIENFFAIPGLGSVLVNAIQLNDFAVIRVSVFLGSLLYQAGLILTDICYAVADPRIRLR